MGLRLPSPRLCYLAKNLDSAPSPEFERSRGRMRGNSGLGRFLIE